MRQDIMRAGTDELTFTVKDHGQTVVPSSCSIRIIDHGVVLESGNAPLGKYTPGAATVGKMRQDITAEWTFQLSGAPPQKYVTLFDVVAFKLYPMITDDDVVREVSSLGSVDFVVSGTVTDEDVQGFADSSLIGAHEDYVGAIMTMVSGVDAGGQYVVTAFDASLGKLTYVPTVAAVAGDRYTLRRSYAGEIDSAWEDVFSRLEQACSQASGDRAALIMSPDRLRRPHLMKTLEKVFRGMATDPSGVDWTRAEHYAKEFDAAWNGIRLVFAEKDVDIPTNARDGLLVMGFRR